MKARTLATTLLITGAMAAVGCAPADDGAPMDGALPTADGVQTPASEGGSLLHSAVAASASSDTLEVYRTPTCGCCGMWAEHMEAAGFVVRIHDLPDLTQQKASVGVPTDLASCHTAVIGGYVVEGHVPADAVKRMLAERPQVAGIAVPGMPLGSPGMEVPGQPADPYTIFSFNRDGSRAVFENR